MIRNPPLIRHKLFKQFRGPGIPVHPVYPGAAIQLFSHHLQDNLIVLSSRHTPRHGIVIKFCASQYLLTRLIAQGDSRYQAIHRDRTAEGRSL